MPGTTPPSPLHLVERSGYSQIKAKAQRRPVRRLNNANLTGSSLVDALNKGLATYTGANLSGLDLDRRFFYLGCYRTLQN